jgi:hypothetical protein
MTGATALTTFRISDVDLERDPLIKEAYEQYSRKRSAFGGVLKELKEAARVLHEKLDEPLRSAGFVPEGKDWALKEDDYEGLIILETKSNECRRVHADRGDNRDSVKRTTTRALSS